jgi:hypothetical protein
MLGRWLVLFASLLSFSAVSQAKWQAATTQHFIIYSKSPPERIEQLADRLESYDKLMRMATGIAEDVEPVRVHIYEVDDLSDIDRAIGEHNSGVAGFYDSNSLGPFLVTPRRADVGDKYFTPELVLQHEYAHHFMLQYFPAVYPGWYTEGFAELIGSSQIMKDGRIGYGMPAKHRGNEILANWVRLQEVLTQERVYNLDTYGQGWAMTHFLTFDSGRAKLFRKYLAALSSGKSPKEAAQVFGDLTALNNEARRYVGAGAFVYRPVKPEIRRPVIQQVRPLSEAEAALIPEVIAFRDDDLRSYRKESERTRQQRQREGNLKRIQEKAARYGNDPFALYLLAEAEAAAGHEAEAGAAADRLLALRPQSIEGLVRKSLTLSSEAARLQGAARSAKAAEARTLAVRANKLAPDDPMPLLAFYESFRKGGQKVTPNALQGLIRAVELLPRNTGVRQLLVNQLEADRRYSEAIAVLQPIANDPHESPLRDAAREQLTRLQAALATNGQKAAATTAHSSSAGCGIVAPSAARSFFLRSSPPA